MSDNILSFIYLTLILVLVMPVFIYMTKNKKTFIKNFSWWTIIVFIILIIVSLY